MFSADAAERLRKMLMERNSTVKALKEEFKEQIDIERDIVGNRRRYGTYPPHVSKLLLAGVRVPFIVINCQLALEGVFPSLEDFRELISEHVNRLQVVKRE